MRKYSTFIIFLILIIVYGNDNTKKANEYYKKGDFDNAFLYYVKGASQNDNEAIDRLRNYVLKKNIAIKYLKRCAEIDRTVTPIFLKFITEKHYQNAMADLNAINNDSEYDFILNYSISFIFQLLNSNKATLITEIINSNHSEDFLAKLIFDSGYEEKFLKIIITYPLSEEIKKNMIDAYGYKTTKEIISSNFSDKFITNVFFSRYSELLKKKIVLENKYSEQFLQNVIDANLPEDKLNVIFDNELPENLVAEYIFEYPLEIVVHTIKIPLYKNNEQKELKEIENLFIDKDEFETTKEFENRIKSANYLKSEIIKKYQSLNQELEKEITYELNIIKERQIADRNKLIHESITDIDLKIEEIGNYNADEELFPIKINGVTENVNIPRKEARSFKENAKDVEVKALKKLKPDLKGYTYFNYTIIHPVTGAIYKFGKHENIDNLQNFTVESSKKIMDPPSLSYEISFIEPNGNKYLDADETGEIKIKIKNDGKGNAYNIFIDIKPKEKNENLSVSPAKYIEILKPNETKDVSINLSANINVKNTKNEFEIFVNESNGFNPQSGLFTFETKEKKYPDFDISDFEISSLTGKNKIIPGELTKITTRIANIGEGDAYDIIVSVKLPEHIFFSQNSKTNFSINKLPKNAHKDIEFEIYTNNLVKDKINIELNIIEKYNAHKKNLALEVNKPKSKLQQYIVEGESEEILIKEIEKFSIDIEKDIPLTSLQNKNAIAVVFGVENYRNVSSVTFAERDAYFVKEYFVRTLGIQEDQIYYKTNEEVTKGEFEKVFSKDGWLNRRISKNNSDVYIYYAGHGAPDINNKKAYLIPFDGDPNYASQTGYDIDKLYENLSIMKAKSTTIFLDACFSGSDRENQMLLADARPVFVEVKNPLMIGNNTVFSATSGTQISTAWNEMKHGLFTYYLLKGFSGQADSNNDYAITIDEIEKYLKSNVQKQASYLDREQIPEVHATDKNRVLINLK